VIIWFKVAIQLNGVDHITTSPQQANLGRLRGAVGLHLGVLGALGSRLLLRFVSKQIRAGVFAQWGFSD
jgi:hypothetical protein